ncbi:MAG: ABC transporter ATP-binding protein [Bacteroidales bacterium]|nr:ABC transporter ATP-binding protein [Bacteroidales bacterium]
MKPYLKISGLSCGYKDAFQLKNISLGALRGNLVGIIGPNGSGKTTLFKGLTGELPLRSGIVELNGVDLNSISIREKAMNIAVVTQRTEQLEITVEDYVVMGRIPYRKAFQFFETGSDYAIAKKYMKLTNVYRFRHKLMSQLSGGEQQLVAIARALTQEPELLLLDEPTSQLDISHQVQVLNLVQQLDKELNLTVLMIIHDLNLAGEYCDYLVMLNNGEVFVKGTPQEVLTYENIENVYKTVVITQTNPLSKRPAVFLVSNKVLTKSNKETK